MHRFVNYIHLLVTAQNNCEYVYAKIFRTHNTSMPLLLNLQIIYFNEIVCYELNHVCVTQ